MILVFVFGVFGLVGGGVLVLFGIVLLVFGLYYMGFFECLLMLVFGLVGVVVLVGWLWLSVVYFWCG